MITTVSVSAVFGYDNITTHPQISEAAIKIYQTQAGKNLTAEQAAWIVHGSVGEDADPRYLNHYYDPTTGKGLDGIDEIFGKVSGGSAKEWAKKQDSLTGDYSEGAILKNYREGNYKRAYLGIGHILHLIQDMSVPAHTRNDSHAQGDPYETWAKQNGKVDVNKANFIAVNSLDQAFDELAMFSHKNFFSEDTVRIENINDYKKVRKFENNIEVEYLINRVDDKEYRLAFSKNPNTPNPIFIIGNHQIHSDYWQILHPKSVGYNAGVIEYFIKQFEQIDIEKQQTREQGILAHVWNGTKTAISNIDDNIKYLWGDAVITIRVSSALLFEESKENILTVKNSIQNAFSQPKKVSPLANTADIGQALNNQNNLIIETPPSPSTQAAANSTNNLQPPAGDKEEINPADSSGSDAPASGETDNSQSATGGKESDSQSQNQSQPQNQPDTGQNQLAQNQNNLNPNLALPWQGYIFASPQAETNNQQQTTNNEEERTDGSDESVSNGTDSQQQGTEELSEPDVIPPSKPQITSHQNNQYLNESADESEDEGVQITLKGTADAFSVVVLSQECSDDGELSDAETTADNLGFFEIQITLCEGENIFAISAEDESGGESETLTLTLILDTTPPEPVSGLKANPGQSRGEVILIFAKPQENFELAEYEIRYSTKPIVPPPSDENEISDLPANEAENETTYENAEFSRIFPPSGNSEESLAIPGLVPGQTYYFALKSKDKAGNVSEISNIVQSKPGAKSANIVISEFKVRGDLVKRSGDEFIELYNPTEQEVSLENWSIQYLGSQAKKFENIEKKNFEAGRKIPPHGFFLITKNNGYEGFTPPDMSHSAFSLSESGGTIFLAAFQEKLTGPDDSNIIDKVGYSRNPSQPGENIYSEGQTLKISDGGYSYERKAEETSTAESLKDKEKDLWLGNSYDTGNNADDFVRQDALSPQNSASLPEPKDESWEIKPAASAWPSQFYDEKGSRKSPNSGPAQNPTLVWQTQIGDENLKTPALSQDGLLHVASYKQLNILDSQTGEIKRQVKTINSENVSDWSFGPNPRVNGGNVNIFGYPSSPAAVDNFGNAYFSVRSSGYYPAAVIAITNEGKIRFLNKFSGRPPSVAPFIGGSSTIYNMAGEGGLFENTGINAFYPDGTEKWNFKKNGGDVPRMDENETFYIHESWKTWGASGNAFHIIDKDGNALAQTPMNGGASAASNCLLVSEEYVFECEYNSSAQIGYLNIFDKQGNLLLFKYSFPADPTSTITQINEGEFILVRNYEGNKYRGRIYDYSLVRDAEGDLDIQMNWYFEFPEEDKAVSIPIMDGNKIVYFTSQFGKIYAFDFSRGTVDERKKLQDDAILWTFDLGLAQGDEISPNNNLILDGNKTLYAVSQKGRVFAVSESLSVIVPDEDEEDEDGEEEEYDDGEDEEEGGGKT